MSAIHQYKDQSGLNSDYRGFQENINTYFRAHETISTKVGKITRTIFQGFDWARERKKSLFIGVLLFATPAVLVSQNYEDRQIGSKDSLAVADPCSPNALPLTPNLIPHSYNDYMFLQAHNLQLMVLAEQCFRSQQLWDCKSVYFEPQTNLNEKNAFDLILTYPGFCIGERHAYGNKMNAAIQFFKTHIPYLKQHGVKTIYIENVDRSTMSLVEAFNKKLSDDVSWFSQYLSEGYTRIFRLARECGVRIIPVDCRAKSTGGDLGISIINFNYCTFAELQNHDPQRGKFVIWGGLAHMSTVYDNDRKRLVPGISELLGIPSVIPTFDEEGIQVKEEYPLFVPDLTTFSATPIFYEGSGKVNTMLKWHVANDLDEPNSSDCS